MLEDQETKKKLAEMKQRNEEERIEKRKGDIKVVCSTPEGRRFVWDILAASGVYFNSFVPGMPDTTAYNEGKRNIGVELLKRLHEADKSLIQKILLEHWSVVQSKKNEKARILKEGL